MKIIVCVKPVPDTATKIKVHSSGTRVDPEGVKYVMGPYDARACAKAIELRDSIPGSEVIAISSGGSDGERDARKRRKDALALGANKGVFIADPDPEFRDPL